MHLLVIFLWFGSMIAYGQEHRQESAKVFKVANVILIFSPLPDSQTYRVVKQILVAEGKPLAKTDTSTFTISSELFTLTPSYDMQLDVQVQDGLVSLWANAFDRTGTSLGTSYHSELTGSARSFAHLNYLALMLQAKLKSPKIRYALE